MALVDPDGFTLTPGSAAPYVTPAPHEHGTPPVAALVAAPFVAGADGVPRLPRITGDPPFKVKGPQKGKPGLDRVEFARQLTGQQQGLNHLTVAEFLANRDQYLAKALRTGDGRDSVGDAAQRLAREDAFSDKIHELRSQDRSLTAEQAQQWLDTQAALHHPDQVAGGHANEITGLGNARVPQSGAPKLKALHALRGYRIS